MLVCHGVQLTNKSARLSSLNKKNRHLWWDASAALVSLIIVVLDKPLARAEQAI